MSLFYMESVEPDQDIEHRIAHEMLLNGRPIIVGEWQGLKDNRPQMRTLELEDVTLDFEVSGHVGQWQSWVKPNLPWAEDHFQERISKKGLNPPPSASYWPYAQQDNAETRTIQGKFSHTYPERFWPNYREDGSNRYREEYPRGIRFAYGDLDDLIQLLIERPHTRQAYLPIWFPEDGTAAVTGERVPCTLGYHFLIRGNELKITYYMRSCDYYRYLRDDIYMAGRLAQYVADQVMTDDEPPSLRLLMHISSLHIFEDEIPKMAMAHNKCLKKDDPDIKTSTDLLGKMGSL